MWTLSFSETEFLALVSKSLARHQMCGLWYEIAIKQGNPKANSRIF